MDMLEERERGEIEREGEKCGRERESSFNC